MDSPDRPRAFGRAIPGSQARFSTAKEPSVRRSPPQSLPTQSPAAILPWARSSLRQSQTRNPSTNQQFHERRFHGIHRLARASRRRETASHLCGPCFARTTARCRRRSGGAISEGTGISPAPSGGSIAHLPGGLRDPARGRDGRGRYRLCHLAPERVQGRGAGDRSDRSACVRVGGRYLALAACAGPHRGRAGREHQGSHGGARGRQGQSRDPAFRWRPRRPHAYDHDHAARSGRDRRAQGRQGAEDRRPAERHDRRHARGAARRQPVGAGARLLWHHPRQGAQRCAAGRRNRQRVPAEENRRDDRGRTGHLEADGRGDCGRGTRHQRCDPVHRDRGGRCDRQAHPGAGIGRDRAGCVRRPAAAPGREFQHARLFDPAGDQHQDRYRQHRGVGAAIVPDPAESQRRGPGCRA